MKSYKNLKFSDEAIYKIIVQGKLDKDWAESIGGLAINTEKRKEEGYITTLEGLLKDQSALSSVLNFLYDMHLTVISVECLEANKRHMNSK